jgi:hypothetical protein
MWPCQPWVSGCSQGLLGLFTVVALIGGTASAAAIITRDTITIPFFETGAPPVLRRVVAP